nr:RNA-directed DNA polymerase, eukaryota [Tanacetum cinerariifolium]
YYLQANIVRYQRERKTYDSQNSFKRNVGISSDSFNWNVGNYSNSFAFVLKSGKPIIETTGREVPSLVLDDTCFSNRDFNSSLMGKVKDITALPNLYVILKEEGFQNFKISYLGGMWVLIELKSFTTSQKFIKHAGVGSWFSSLQPASNSFVSDKRIVWISIEGLPLKVWSFNTFLKVASKWGELVEWKNIKDNNFSRKQLCVKTKLNEIICERFKVIIQGNVHWVRAKEMEGWDPQNYESDKEVDKVSESSCMQGDALFYDNDNNKSKESNVQSEDLFNIYDLLNKNKNKESDGNSKEGELKYPPGFTPKETSVNDVHKKEMKAPSEEVKQNLYNSIRNNSLNASYCSQRFKAGLSHKTKKGWIKELCMKNRVNFVSLQETKIEHIELVTINKLWGNSSYDYAFSSSLELTEKRTLWDYLLRLINRWDGKCVIMGDFNEVRSEYERRNFKPLKLSLENGQKMPRNVQKKSSIQSKLFDIDKIIDQGGSNEVILNDRSILLKELRDIISLDLEEMAQKAKVRWAIESDENSKYFHGILNNKRSHLAIRGVLVNEDWIVKSNYVKNEFLNHFSSQFDRPVSYRICLANVFNNQLSLEQQDYLERTISIKEIKRAMWDCGTNKSPGPDGFTFEFFRRYWKFFENNISVAVIEFLSSGTFPKGCNSSFIALIPKTQNAKSVKIFRPISLIGSLYKIIAKIMANRLSYVIPDLISNVQSAFISNRQILDGPFILNELLS